MTDKVSEDERETVMGILVVGLWSCYRERSLRRRSGIPSRIPWRGGQRDGSRDNPSRTTLTLLSCDETSSILIEI